MNFRYTLARILCEFSRGLYLILYTPLQGQSVNFKVMNLTQSGMKCSIMDEIFHYLKSVAKRSQKFLRYKNSRTKCHGLRTCVVKRSQIMKST